MHAKKVRMTKTRPSRPVILSRDETRRLLVWWRRKMLAIKRYMFIFISSSCMFWTSSSTTFRYINLWYLLFAFFLSFSTNFKHIGDRCSHETRNSLVRWISNFFLKIYILVYSNYVYSSSIKEHNKIIQVYFCVITHFHLPCMCVNIKNNIWYF